MGSCCRMRSSTPFCRTMTTSTPHPSTLPMVRFRCQRRRSLEQVICSTTTTMRTRRMRKLLKGVNAPGGHLPPRRQAMLYTREAKRTPGRRRRRRSPQRKRRLRRQSISETLEEEDGAAMSSDGAEMPPDAELHAFPSDNDNVDVAPEENQEKEEYREETAKES